MSIDLCLLVPDVVLQGWMISGLSADPMESGRGLIGCAADGSMAIASVSLLSPLSLMTVW